MIIKNKKLKIKSQKQITIVSKFLVEKIKQYKTKIFISNKIKIKRINKFIVIKKKFKQKITLD